MENSKAEIVKSILRFLHEELTRNDLDNEQKESLEVAKQCLESIYEIDGNSSSVLENAQNLYALLNVDRQLTQDVTNAADELKIRGNKHMKNEEYLEALDLYTRAISLNPKNHIYYCNRAAAYSRLNKHWEAVADCKESIKITPTAKAYARLGVAYSNMNMYQEAKDAYAQARDMDPSNTSYEQNFKLANELLYSQTSSGSMGAGASSQFGINNIGNIVNNPDWLNMASQMVRDPAFVQALSGMMTSGANGDPNMDSFINVTQQLAQELQATNPNLIENLRQNLHSNLNSSNSDEKCAERQPEK